MKKPSKLVKEWNKFKVEHIVMIIQTISDIIQSAFNMGLETVELSTGWYIILYIACLQLIKGTSVVISINKSVMIINVYDTLAKGCQNHLQEFKDYSYKISQHWKKNLFYTT